MNTFKDAQFMTAAEKVLTLRQWKTFLKRLAEADRAPLTGADYGYFPGALDKVFTDRLYKFLSLYGGFIAHYNRRGFLAARFTNSEDIRATFAGLRGRQYFGGYADVADIGRAMVEELDAAARLFAARWAREAGEEEKAERAQLRALQAKYPDEKISDHVRSRVVGGPGDYYYCPASPDGQSTAYKIHEGHCGHCDAVILGAK